MEYTTYEFYVDKYHGKLSYDLFNSIIVKASIIVKNNINRRIDTKNIPEEIQYVVCELIDHMDEVSKMQITNMDGVAMKVKTEAEIEKEVTKILAGLPHEYTRYL